MLITKIIVGRLRPYLCDYITPVQSGFLKGRCTVDNVIVMQEVLFMIHRDKSKIGSIVHKIDLSKAYDNVSWEFLKLCLTEMMIPLQFINLIMTCVSSLFLFLLWNGNNLTSFKPTKGLRQGDPMSPLIFVICMDNLSITINKLA